MSFDYLTMETGDLVDVSTEADFSKAVAGVVSKTESDCCFIKVLGNIEPPLEFCWHVDDPRLANGPEKFNQQQNILTDGGRVPPRTGVFRKSRTQALLEEIPGRLEAVERLLNEVVIDLANLKTPAKEPEPERRRPGRPRKKPPADASSLQPAEPVGVS
jgi:hypothetical protein